MERSKKVLVVSALLSSLFVGSLIAWFGMSSQPPPYQRVPFSWIDFTDYPQELIVNRSQREFHDYHIAIASGKWSGENYEKDIFLGLKLTGFHYTSTSTYQIPNYTGYHEGISINRLDALAKLSNKTLRIEELSLSCEFNKSLGEEVLPLFTDPFAYNLQLIHKTKSYASSSESFIIWKGIDHYHKGFFTDYAPIDFGSYSNSTSHRFIVTLCLTYSFNSSTKRQISTSVCIVIKD